MSRRTEMKTSLENYDAPVGVLSRIALTRACLVFCLISTLGFGVLYSLLGVGLGQLLFPWQANGSVLTHQGRVVGSALVAQPTAAAHYFQPRPSAAAFDPRAVSASNQSRGNPALLERLAEQGRVVAQREGVAPDRVPADLITQSGSGIDPHISVAAARLQAPRVAQNRGLSESKVLTLVDAATAPPTWGVLGQARVNVLQLNLALDSLER